MSKMSNIDQIHIRAVMLCMSKTLEDIQTSLSQVYIKVCRRCQDRSNTHKGCNTMYVEDVEDIKTSHTQVSTKVC